MRLSPTLAAEGMMCASQWGTLVVEAMMWVREARADVGAVGGAARLCGRGRGRGASRVASRWALLAVLMVPSFPSCAVLGEDCSTIAVRDRSIECSTVADAGRERAGVGGVRW